jgi:hypothetical protein
VTAPMPLLHVLAHVRDALATDERVGELGLDVCSEPDPAGGADEVVVRGAVSTAGRKAGVVPVVTEVLRQHGVALPVRDETTVPPAGVPEEEAEAL